MSTREFAERHGVSARSLQWWRWRLGVDAKGKGQEKPRLVAVTLSESAADAHEWELTTAAGHVLRVHGTIEPTALVRVLTAITRRQRSR